MACFGGKPISVSLCVVPRNIYHWSPSATPTSVGGRVELPTTKDATFSVGDKSIPLSESNRELTYRKVFSESHHMPRQCSPIILVSGVSPHHEAPSRN